MDYTPSNLLAANTAVVLTAVDTHSKIAKVTHDGEYWAPQIPLLRG